MDEACKRAIILKIADAIGVSIDEMYDVQRDAGPDGDELAKIMLAFSKVTDTRVRRFCFEELRISADRDGA